METPAQTCARLLTALEDLTAQEAATLEARDFVSAIAIQERAQPLIDHLVAHGPQIADAQFRSRFLALITRRNRTGEWLAEQIARAREQLQTAEAARRRAAQIAPVYGRGVRQQLCGVG